MHRRRFSRRFFAGQPLRTVARSRAVRLGAATVAVLAATVAAAAPTALATTPTAPPPLTILSHTGGLGGRDLFIAPTGDTSTYANGPEILSPSGKVVWFDPLPAGQTPGTSGRRPTTASRSSRSGQGTGFGGLSQGTDYIYNDHYQQIATVKAGNGLSADGHEFLITPWNTALILAYQESTANLTSIGGPANQTVINGVVQEIDIRTGKVLFQWNSADHVPYSQSEQVLPASASSPWDWFHINAVKVNSNGDLLIDGRNTWTTYEVDPQSREDRVAAGRQGLELHPSGGARADAERRRRHLRLAARPGAARSRALLVLRQ